ncbi:MAG: tRNA (guanosine(46)-N7)-methyltransferase TrmB [Planctomycetes bacterium]|nr:tRNA (guanosine(46)-N7)-methyltransferase TrmB [Planctomycetota bacterium]MCB9869997.1 tRNA (guanosine(46)-N7)-methyltransferase TrmB [Planctomycetota bacterium]
MHESESKPRTSRMHADGRLSFRRRVPEVDDPDLPLVLGGEDPPGLRELLPSEALDLEVEIEVGPGKGTFLLAATEARPEAFVLGIEASASYAKYAAEKLKQSGRRNGLLLVDNAKAFLKGQVPAGALRRLHVYFPDPWPKRRHRKRRFFTEEMPEVVHDALAADGWLLVATDNAALAGEITRVLGSSPLLVRDEAEEARLRAGPPGHGFSPTSFERKYRAEGRIIRQYAFRRRDA